MVGGITPIAAPPVLDRSNPPPREPVEFAIEDRAPGPRPMPTGPEVIPPDNGERPNGAREGPIEAVGLGRNDSEEPPPIRPGMKPSVIPP